MREARPFSSWRVWINTAFRYYSRIRMSLITRQQLAVMVADVARRDSLIASWRVASDRDGIYYFEADLRTLYPGCSIAYVNRRFTLSPYPSDYTTMHERATPLYEWVVSMGVEHIATHRV
jgi:hypothetical protein